MTRSTWIYLCALCGLFVFVGAAQAATGTQGMNTSDGYVYNWGTLGYVADYNGTLVSGTGGHRLDWGSLFGDSAITANIEDYVIDEPTGVAGGEYWDVEAIAFVQSGSDYHFLVVLSTAETLYTSPSYPNTSFSVGDLGIGMHESGGSLYAELGVKLAGTNKGAAQNFVKFGYGIAGHGTPAAELRNPLKYTGSNPYGYYPGQPGNAGGNWGSNFAYTGSGPGVSVTWHTVFDGPALGYDVDGPSTTPSSSRLSTYAIEVTVPTSLLPAGVGVVSFAPSCLNDGIDVDGGGGRRVPQLPASMLIGAVPGLSILLKRLRRS